MTQEHDIERLLDRWLSDGPTEAPDRVLNVVADRIERQPQRPAWRFLRRKLPVNGYLKPLVAIAAVVLLVIGGIAILGRPSDSAVGGATMSPSLPPSPSPSPSITPSPGASTGSAWWLGGRASCSPCLGELAGGTQSSASFKPVLSYTVPAGWINHYDAPDGFGLMPDVPGNRSNYESGTRTLQDLTLIRSVRVAASDCSDAPAAGVGLLAADIVGAIAERPGLETSVPVDVSVGGLSGKQIDVALASDWKTPCPDSEGQPSVPLIKSAGEGAHWGAVPGERFRLIVLDLPKAVGGGPILIDIYAQQASEFDSHLAATMPIIDSFEFDLTP